MGSLLAEENELLQKATDKTGIYLTLNYTIKWSNKFKSLLQPLKKQPESYLDCDAY